MHHTGGISTRDYEIVPEQLREVELSAFPSWIDLPRESVPPRSEVVILQSWQVQSTSAALFANVAMCVG